MTSSAHDADLKGNNFKRTIHPQSFIAVAFIFSELDQRGASGASPSGPEDRKKARSVSVVSFVSFIKFHAFAIL